MGLVYGSRPTCLNLMAEITMAKQLLASEPCRLPACLLKNLTLFAEHCLLQCCFHCSYNCSEHCMRWIVLHG